MAVPTEHTIARTRGRLDGGGSDKSYWVTSFGYQMKVLLQRHTKQSRGEVSSNGESRRCRSSVRVEYYDFVLPHTTFLSILLLMPLLAFTIFKASCPLKWANGTRFGVSLLMAGGADAGPGQKCMPHLLQSLICALNRVCVVFARCNVENASRAFPMTRLSTPSTWGSYSCWQ